jgi:hypothetical protein
VRLDGVAESLPSAVVSNPEQSDVVPLSPDEWREAVMSTVAETGEEPTDGG